MFDGVTADGTGPQSITERATEFRPREAGVRSLSQWSPDPAVCQTDRSPTAVVSVRAEFRKVIHDPFPTNREICRSQPAIVFQFNERDEGRPDA
jgi:hypothetical protein